MFLNVCEHVENEFHFIYLEIIFKINVSLSSLSNSVDASAAGEGQLEISINEGEVPNHVQVVGGGRCLVSFTPEIAKPHYIDIKFNGETVNGCPFICSIADTSRVSLNLTNLGIIAFVFCDMWKLFLLLFSNQFTLHV